MSFINFNHMDYAALEQASFMYSPVSVNSVDLVSNCSGCLYQSNPPAFQLMQPNFNNQLIVDNSENLNLPAPEILEFSRNRMQLQQQQAEMQNTQVVTCQQPKLQKIKRTRTIFSSDQLIKLEKEFQANSYVSKRQRFAISRTLHLTEKQIKIWFQNRRMKKKQEVAVRNKEEKETAEEPAKIEALPTSQVLATYGVLPNNTVPTTSTNYETPMLPNGPYQAAHATALQIQRDAAAQYQWQNLQQQQHQFGNQRAATQYHQHQVWTQHQNEQQYQEEQRLAANTYTAYNNNVNGIYQNNVNYFNQPANYEESTGVQQPTLPDLTGRDVIEWLQRNVDIANIEEYIDDFDLDILR